MEQMETKEAKLKEALKELKQKILKIFLTKQKILKMVVWQRLLKMKVMIFLLPFS